MTDDDFEAACDAAWRVRSRRYWTPASVAREAARWLTEDGVDRVLDVGSGAGKFCIIGATSTSATFVGIEQRLPLVVAARRTAARLGVGVRAQFLHCEADAGFLAQFRALYLFNPFAENLYEAEYQLDTSVELSAERYGRDVALVEEALGRLPLGARVVTYHGFGGRLPSSFELVRERAAGSDRLCMFAKKRTSVGRAMQLPRE